MNNKRLEKKFLIAVIVGSIINLLILSSWFLLRIKPIIPETQYFKEDIINKEIKDDYQEKEELINDINLLSEEYNIIINVEDYKGNQTLNNNVKVDIPLINKMVKVENEPYLLKIYFDNHTNITRSFIEILMFQILIVSVLFIIAFAYTRQIVLKPINQIIDDIRNYQFGKKPKKRKFDNELDMISDEFYNLTNKLDDEKKEQSRIIASISHDIKTPLTSIIGYSNLLKESKLKKEEQIYNEKIYDKAINIKEILSTFDDYITNQEKIELKKTRVQISKLVEELNNDYKIELNNNNIDFIINTKLKNQSINIDVLKIKRIFSNIISNSTRYLKEKGKIEINIEDIKDNYIFKISDNGPGVKEEIIDKIFDPLFTTDYSRKISGLGLSICKEFVEMHGGTIKAYNDNGLTIEFTIPKEK